MEAEARVVAAAQAAVAEAARAVGVAEAVVAAGVAAADPAEAVDLAAVVEAVAAAEAQAAERLLLPNPRAPELREKVIELNRSEGPILLLLGISRQSLTFSVRQNS